MVEHIEKTVEAKSLEQAIEFSDLRPGQLFRVVKVDATSHPDLPGLVWFVGAMLERVPESQ